MNLSFIRSIGFLFFENDTEYAPTFPLTRLYCDLTCFHSNLKEDQSYDIYAFVNTTIL